MGNGEELASEPMRPDPIEALRAISTCLRHLACGWSLHPAEHAACISLLRAGIPGVDAADMAAAQKILAATRRQGRRQRDRAAELSVRLAEQAAAAAPR